MLKGVTIMSRVLFISNDKECKYIDVKKLKVDCSHCGRGVIVKLNQNSWECLSCLGVFNPFGIIYKATKISNGKIYVGQTITTLKERIRGHLSERKERTYFGLALKKYGVDDFIWEIIDHVENNNTLNKKELEKKLNEKETKWIKHFNSFVGWDSSNGYNLTTGGGNFSLAEVSVAKRSAERHGLSKLTEEQVKTIRLLLRDTGMYLKEIALIMGISLTTVYDIGRRRIWKSVNISDVDVLYDNFKEYINLFPKERNTFLAFDVSSQTLIGEFANQRECAELLEIDYRNLNVVLKGRRNTTSGYTFIYKEMYTDKWLKETLPKLKSNIGKRFFVYNFKTGEFVKEYRNQNECARELSLDHAAINECLWKKQSFHKEYIFIFEEDYDGQWIKTLTDKAIKNKRLSNK
jgi:group I intron endonuclease